MNALMITRYFQRQVQERLNLKKIVSFKHQIPTFLNLTKLRFRPFSLAAHHPPIREQSKELLV
jgi:hypothetical protein